MKTLVSGVKPTGTPTIGNYIGAIKQFVNMQNEMKDTKFFFFIADLHAITTPIDRLELRKNIKEIAALYIACGLDPKKSTIFIQSEVPEHATLGYIMESTAYIGEMERMTQYKDKRHKQQLAGVRVSLLTYPALMAADILMYDADFVPIGEDQTQHLEMARTVAERFNNQYGKTFVVPKGVIPKHGARIKSLVDPLKKMDKSDDNPKAYITLLDNVSQAKNKIRSAVTDSETKIYFNEHTKPGISNLLTIYSCLTDKLIEDLENIYQDKSYKDLKDDLALIVEDTLVPIQSRFNELLNSTELDDILDQGAQEASIYAKRKIKSVYQKMGLGRKKQT